MKRLRQSEKAAAKEKSRDAKKVDKAKEKAKTAGAELSDRIKKTQTYTSGMSQSTKTASSTGQGTGASDALGAAISNAGSAVKSVTGFISTTFLPLITSIIFLSFLLPFFSTSCRNSSLQS